MTDKQTKEIVYAILGGAFLIALAIRPPTFSFSDVLIGIGFAVLFGLGALAFYLWEAGWLLPIVIGAAVAGVITFGAPIRSWFIAKPATTAVNNLTTSSPRGYVLDSDRYSTTAMNAWIENHKTITAQWIKDNGGNPTQEAINAWNGGHKAFLYAFIKNHRLLDDGMEKALENLPPENLVKLPSGFVLDIDPNK